MIGLQTQQNVRIETDVLGVLLSSFRPTGQRRQLVTFEIAQTVGMTALPEKLSSTML